MILSAVPAAAFAQTMPGMDMGAQPSSKAAPVPKPPPVSVAPSPPPAPAHASPAPPPQGGMPGMNMGGGESAVAADRWASGTAWQPAVTPMAGPHVMAGDWMLMAHGQVNGVADWQSGPRGGDKGFVSGMLMAMAQRSFAGGGTFQLRAMLSPEPLMGADGYPLLLASGETANGRDPLVDRQHPHDLFMELSARAEIPLGGDAVFFLYGGLPGEPAFGPPAFMHRLSIMDSPEAPITHHWLDSTHVSFGVATAGLVWRNWKIDASRFNGREPDQDRWDIETGPLDSTALRLSWNPVPRLSLQASWARLIHPEQLEPMANQIRWSASAIWTQMLGLDRWWSTTLAWGRRSSEAGWLDGLALESAVKLGAITLFARGEIVGNDELAGGGARMQAYGVGKISLGAIRDFRLAPHLSFGVGALVARDFVPRPLAASYGGDRDGAMAFIRLKFD
ncbi:MAG TPA: hypothetical protein VFW19_13145 [Allosphingosinicella sp.]|nr:hypothetical protein [Allosphingosinicella sp.]